MLLSYESAWIAVLNHIFVSCEDVEGETWDANLAALGVDAWQRPLPEPWEAQMIASWDRIFDLAGLHAGGAWSDDIQATFEELRLEDVIQVTHYKTR